MGFFGITSDLCSAGNLPAEAPIAIAVFEVLIVFHQLLQTLALGFDLAVAETGSVQCLPDAVAISKSAEDATRRNVSVILVIACNHMGRNELTVC